MRQLNYLTMLTALRRCLETPFFKVGIFAKTHYRARRVFAELLGEVANEASDFYNPTTSTEFVSFKNGSEIRVLSTSAISRGYIFHEVLYEDGISKELLGCIVFPAERILYK